jgi:hypothetical protein
MSKRSPGGSVIPCQKKIRLTRAFHLSIDYSRVLLRPVSCWMEAFRTAHTDIQALIGLRLNRWYSVREFGE